MRPSKFIAIFIISLFGVFSSCDEDAANLQGELTQFDTAADWMQKILNDFPDTDIRLIDICMPRSHDAGMYLVQRCTIGASACNVQTQHQNFAGQLLDGIRSFDVRPILKNNVYFTRHSQGCDGLGCYGGRVDHLLEDVRDFLDEHKELVILELNHWCYTNEEDEEFINMVESILGDRIFKEIVTDPLPFIQRPLRDIIPANGPTGKVILKYGGAANTEANRANGIFASSYIPKAGRFSNAQQFDDLKIDQLDHYSGFDFNGSKLFEFSWTMTQDETQALSCLLSGTPASIESLAEITNSNLNSCMSELISDGQIAKGRIPNIISVDYSASFVTEECMRISHINLE